MYCCAQTLSRRTLLFIAPATSSHPSQLRKFPTLCLASAPPDTANTNWLVLATCDASDPRQQWKWNFEGIAPDNERKSAISNVDGCIDQYGQGSDIGQQLDAYPCNRGENQAFWCATGDLRFLPRLTLPCPAPLHTPVPLHTRYDWDEGMIGNEATGVCLGVGPCTDL